MAKFVAVDLGASSGRVITARVGRDVLEPAEVHRFANRPVRVAGTLHWDILGLYREVLTGLRAAAGRAPDSIGIDSWAVDFGLLDDHGALLGDPVCYRDTRTEGMRERVRERVADERLYELNGLQFLPFNTIYQLAASAGRLPSRGTLLLIPDLLAYWLTGRIGAEVTNASTTGLLDVTTRSWSRTLMSAVGVPEGLLPPLRQPGDRIGPLVAEAAAETGLPTATQVTAVATHDTASAVAAVPATQDHFGYISCGTWSLVGVELPGPVLTAESRRANFTNEAGVDGTVRYLRNVMGLWLLQESLRAWGDPDLPGLLAAAASLPPLRYVINPDAPEFLPPGDMPARIAEHCRATGRPPPESQPEMVRCVIDSLALGHRAALRRAARLAGHRIDVVHLVGGGSRNELLCQMTADACGIPVIAGPVEATAIGNVLIQARAFGLVADLAQMRGLVAGTQQVVRYEPRDLRCDWAEAAARVGLEV